MFRRLLVLLVFGALPLAAVLGASRSFSLGEPSLTAYRGTLLITWVDDQAGERPPPARYQLLDPSGGTITLFPGEVSEADLSSLYLQEVVVSGAPQEESRPADGAGMPAPLVLKSIALAAERSAASPDIVDPTWPVAGNTRWVTLLCKFADIPLEPDSLAFYHSLFSSDYPGMNHFWREASYDKINLDGSDTYGWYTLPKTLQQYKDAAGGVIPDCMKAADPDVYFPDYFGILLIYNDPFLGAAWGGGFSSTLDGGIDRVYHYVAIPYAEDWKQSILQHEMGHAYGMPHSFAAANPYGNPWDVVSRERYGCDDAVDPVYGCIGQHMMTFSRYDLNWIDPDRLYVAGPGEHALTLVPATMPEEEGYLLAFIPIKGSATHFYTVEARRRVGYDSKLPGDAVVIHEIGGPNYGRQLVDASRFNVGDGDSAMWLPGEAFGSAESDVIVQVTGATATGFKVAISNGGNQQQSKSAAPGADTYVSEGQPAKNFGNELVLRVNNNPKMWTALMFDGSQVPPATYRMRLRMRVVSGDAAAQGTVYTQPSDSICWRQASWTENTLNWLSFTPLNCPNYQKEYAKLGLPTRDGEWVYWDLTAFGAKNGLNKVMIMDSAGPMSYSSREGSNPPELLIDYLILPGAATATFTPTPKPSSTATATATKTPSPSKTATPTGEPSSTPSATATATSTPNISQTATATATQSGEPTATAAATATLTARPTASATPQLVERPYVVWLPAVWR